MNCLKLDRLRYNGGRIPFYQKLLRKYKEANYIMKKIYRPLFALFRFFYNTEISADSELGAGLYIVHPFCITINPQVKIGKNCNIHKGVTIGQENRGTRKGTPIIGDEVWIGVNATIVGRITIGNDVLIAPNSFVNKDVPSHSVVFGNPCVIKHKDNATEGYINNKI